MPFLPKIKAPTKVSAFKKNKNLCKLLVLSLFKYKLVAVFALDNVIWRNCIPCRNT